jgi:DNA-binding transcriptional MocR family regulator
MLKYRALYEQYRGLIDRGVYAPGERLPSLRSVAASEGLGLNTVRAAFGLLEGDGMAMPLERGGYYVRARNGRLGSIEGYRGPEDCRVSEGLSSSQKIDYLLAKGGAASGFALAEPDSSLLPVARLERLHGSLRGSWIDYGEQAGDEELRRRIAALYHPYHGDLRPENIVVTNGATEAIGIAIRALVEPGAAVAVESPTYYDYFRQLAAARACVVEIPVREGRGMDLELLERAMRSRRIACVIAQPNVHNPTGIVMPPADKRRLVELASRFGAILVQDDVYGDLAFSGERPGNLSAILDYERIVYVSSFSKSLAPGLRVGWMHSRAYRAELSRGKSLCSLMNNRPAQAVLSAYLRDASYRKHLTAMRAELEGQLEDYLDCLSGALPEGSSLVRPGGGCLLWIALPKGSDASRLFEAAASDGILFAPGELFSANPFFRGHMRLNFGYRLTERRRGELARLCEMSRRLGPRVHSTGRKKRV